MLYTTESLTWTGKHESEVLLHLVTFSL